jgi:SecD/SecF fusion protein
MIRAALALAALVGGTLAFTALGAGAGGEAACPGSSTPSLELVYEFQPGKGRVAPSSRAAAEQIVCRRSQALGLPGASVRSLAEKRLRVVLPNLGSRPPARRVVDLLGGSGKLRFYDWEANLIGRERVIGAHPGREPRASALRSAEREWKAAGRSTRPFGSKELIFAGALPTKRSAFELASTQEPGSTVIVSEQPSSRLGKTVAAAPPGWYALRNRPALTGSEIVNPVQGTDALGMPNVSFQFSEKGRVDFQQMTRTIAERGQAQVIGPVAADMAEALSGHLAVVFEDEVETRPIVNFAENPDGIDGRTGAQISGAFNTVEEAQDLAAILSIGPLPAEMRLVRQRSFRTRRSKPAGDARPRG